MDNETAKPCPFCGSTDIVFGENEDWGFIACNGCNASLGLILDELPGYHEYNDCLDSCPKETQQPLVDKWNSRTEPFNTH